MVPADNPVRQFFKEPFSLFREAHKDIRMQLDARLAIRDQSAVSDA